MSWLRDKEEDIVNLEHVRALQVKQFEGDVGPDEYCLVACFPGDAPDVILFEGSEAECRKQLDLVATKLPMVRV